MSNDKMGGPAFPQTITEGVQGDRTFPHEYGLGGMTLRDHFAGQALVGMMARMEGVDDKEFARWAYECADAMLAERAKREKGDE